MHVYPNYCKKIHNYIKKNSSLKYKKKLFGKYKDVKLIIWRVKIKRTNYKYKRLWKQTKENLIKALS